MNRNGLIAVCMEPGCPMDATSANASLCEYHAKRQPDPRDAELARLRAENERLSELLRLIEAHAVNQDEIAHEKRADAPCSADAHHNAASAIFRALDVVLADGKRRWATCLGRWHAFDGKEAGSDG